MTKVYIVRYGECSDQGIAGVFSSKEKAEFYCKIQNEIDNCYTEDYWVDERILDEGEYPVDARVATYYEVSIYLEDHWNFDRKILFGKKGYFTLDEDEDEIVGDKRIYTKDVEIEIRDSDEFNSKTITVSSIKSLKHAKKVALDEYYKYMAKKEGLSE